MNFSYNVYLKPKQEEKCETKLHQKQCITSANLVNE